MGTADFTPEELEAQGKHAVQPVVPDQLDCLQVCAAVAARFHVNSVDLLGPSRAKTVAHARHIAMYVCRKYLAMSYPEIGRAFGGKDHTTVISAFQKIDARLACDIEMNRVMREVLKELGIKS